MPSGFEKALADAEETGAVALARARAECDRLRAALEEATQKVLKAGRLGADRQDRGLVIVAKWIWGQRWPR